MDLHDFDSIINEPCFKCGRGPDGKPAVRALKKPGDALMICAECASSGEILPYAEVFSTKCWSCLGFAGVGSVVMIDPNGNEGLMCSRCIATLDSMRDVIANSGEDHVDAVLEALAHMAIDAEAGETPRRKRARRAKDHLSAEDVQTQAILAARRASAGADSAS